MHDLDFKLLLAILLATSWTLDFATVRALSPKRRVLANPIVARLGYGVAPLGFLIALVPFYSPVVAVALLGPGLLLAAHNLDRLWLARALGEALLARPYFNKSEHNAQTSLCR